MSKKLTIYVQNVIYCCNFANHFLFWQIRNMIATEQYIREAFEYYNKLIFSNSLPLISIKLSRAKSFLGQLTYKRKVSLFGKVEYTDFCLRINCKVDLEKDELDDTIIHEMIHYYIAYNKIADTSTHGVQFRRLMNAINKKYSRHITITHHGTQEQNDQLRDKKAKWHVVAVVKMKDGKTGIKVIPRVIERIVYYYNNVSRSPEVDSVRLYLVLHPYFNQFPNSDKLNVVYVEPDKLVEPLANARQLIYKDGHIQYLKSAQ